MFSKTLLVAPALILSFILQSNHYTLFAQSAIDRKGDTRNNAPTWTDLTKFSIVQETRFLSFTLETADTIPKQVSDSCQFQILLQPEIEGVPSVKSDQSPATFLIAFDLFQWDGSPWFATKIYSRFAKNGIPADTVRMFDWKLSGNSFKIRFSLESLGWNSLKAKTRVLYQGYIADVLPDTGWISVLLDQTGRQAMKTRSSAHTIFTYPESFDSIISRYDVLRVVDAAYGHELALTLTNPIGGDSIRFVFNPFFGGAAIEGDPIFLGPGMWGKNPRWFVYFHEMGHNFVNATARFRQLYPLEMRLVPGPLPTHILFYEAWASLPAMYAYDFIDHFHSNTGILDSALSSVRSEWSLTRTRFEKAWKSFLEKPVYNALNPDVVDGMFLELQQRFGWKVFEKFFVIMQPVAETLPLFDYRLQNDTADLRTTRCTLTAAALSSAAEYDLHEQFKEWAFPIDDRLFTKAFNELGRLTH